MPPSADGREHLIWLPSARLPCRSSDRVTLRLSGGFASHFDDDGTEAAPDDCCLVKWDHMTDDPKGPVAAIARLAKETGITEAQARELVAFLGPYNWPSLLREAHILTKKP